MPFNYGFLSHSDPLVFDPNNYILTTNGFGLFLTQVIIIILLCQLLGRLFKLIGQPAVVGELLAGILLGPTALGNIPGFTQTIVPTQALGLLKLMATIGLSLFLFLIGLETDTELMAKYWRQVVLITLPGMAIPFGIAVGIARLIWSIETDQSVKFTTFFLFVGTVMAVTSLSVLSRIMAEMNILSTRLGCITIAAGVCNDLIGYMLLALGSALGTGGKQIDALYQLLAAAGYIALLWFVFRPLMNRLIVRSGFDMSPGAEDRVPEHLLVIALVGALVSAFYTDSMGVHPIVGAFSFGVCCPHGNFAVKVTESIETLVMLVLLPLYFVTSGLSTNFKLLDDGTTWGLIFLLVVGIFVSKFGATAASARLAGMRWREAMCVASLMQSKGIIEIIILNVALQLEVVSAKVFAMLVICFLATTMSVRPLSRYVYFSSLAHDSTGQVKTGTDAKHTNEKRVDGEARTDAGDLAITVAIASPSPAIQTLMLLLDVLGRYGAANAEAKEGGARGQVAVDLLRLLPTEYTTSSIMQLIHYSDERHRDEMMQSLKQVQLLCGVHTSSTLARERHLSATVTAVHEEPGSVPPDTFIVPRSEIIRTIAAQNTRAQARLGGAEAGTELGGGLALVTWEAHHAYGRGLSWLGAAAAASGLSFAKTMNDEDAATSFWQASSDAQSLPARLFKGLRRQCATGVLLDPSTARVAALTRGDEAEQRAAKRGQLEMQYGLQRRAGIRRIVVPFFGGADDRVAVELVRTIVLASAGAVQGVVVAFANETAANAARLAEAEEKARPQVGVDLPLGSAEEDIVHSINLQTIHQHEAARVDARFLFHQQDSATTTAIPEEPPAAAAAAKAASVAEGAVEGLVFVHLRAGGEEATTKPIATMSGVVLPLLDAHTDLLLVGRGKWNQRPRTFRQEVDQMHQTRDHVPDDVRDEISSAGTCLGAATEGFLLNNLTAPAIVLQSALL